MHRSPHAPSRWEGAGLALARRLNRVVRVDTSERVVELGVLTAAGADVRVWENRKRGENVFPVFRKRAADSSVSGEGGGKRRAGDADRELENGARVPGEEKTKDGARSESLRHDPG